MTKRNPVEELDASLQKVQAEGMPAGAAAQDAPGVAELAPLLAASERARRLSAYRLPEARRQHAKAALRAAWVAREAGKAKGWHGRLAWPVMRGRGAVLALALAAVLFASVTLTSIAASEPGSAGYAARVALERAPVLIQRAPGRRAEAELLFAERRLADLEAHLGRTGQLAPAAMDALLESSSAAAAAAAALEGPEQQRIAARINAQAALLVHLAGEAEAPQAQAALEAASTLAAQLAAGLEQPAPEATQPAVEAPASPGPGAPPEPRATPERPAPTLTVAPTETGLPRPTFTPGRSATPAPGRRATEQSATAAPTATRWPTAPAAPTAAPSPQPGRRATALAPQPTAPPTAQPAPTGAGPGPGMRATAQALTATPEPATPPAPPATPEAGPTNAPGPGPGSRATALAQTATPADAPTDGTPTGTAP